MLLLVVRTVCDGGHVCVGVRTSEAAILSSEPACLVVLCPCLCLCLCVFMSALCRLCLMILKCLCAGDRAWMVLFLRLRAVVSMIMLSNRQV